MRVNKQVSKTPERTGRKSLTLNVHRKKYIVSKRLTHITPLNDLNQLLSVLSTVIQKPSSTSSCEVLFVYGENNPVSRRSLTPEMSTTAGLLRAPHFMNRLPLQHSVSFGRRGQVTVHSMAEKIFRQRWSKNSTERSGTQSRRAHGRQAAAPCQTQAG